MKSLTPEQIKALGEQIVALAAVFNPSAAVSIKLLIEAGTQLNGMIKQIRDQTEANAPEVWAAVSKDYGDALAAFEASVPKP